MDRSWVISIRVIANHAAATLHQVHNLRFLHHPYRILAILLLAALLAAQRPSVSPLSARLVSGEAAMQATPAQTATATPPPGNIVVRAASVAVMKGQTTVDAPLQLAGATTELNVGALTVDVHYDTAILQAAACTVSDSFDLLFCNIAVPGVIQLAGVAAGGIRSSLTIADLEFVILQPDNLFTQLTVQLDTIADVEGAALNAIPQHGQIGTPCTPGSENCPIRAVIHLPLIHR
jgi:hypothetical protein